MGRFCVCMDVDAGNDRGVEPRERVVGEKLGLLRDSTRSGPRWVGIDPDSVPLPHRQTSLRFLSGEVRISKVGSLVAAMTRQSLPCSTPIPDRRLDLVKLRPERSHCDRFASWTSALAFAPGPGRSLVALGRKSGGLQGVVKYLRPECSAEISTRKC